MASNANQGSGSGDTNQPKAKRFAWGGGAQVHSKSEAAHRKAVAAKLAARVAAGQGGATAPPVDPRMRDPLYRSASEQAAGEFAPKASALDTLYNSAPSWYGQYMAGSKGAQAASQTYYAPIISDAQGLAGGIGAVGGALDPNSPEAQRAAQAGGNISALAKLGAQTLQSQAAATNDYFGGQREIAARDYPLALAQIVRDRATVKTQQQGRANELYQGLHTDAVNEDIARRTLNLNTSKASADTQLAAGINPLTGEPLPADPVSASDQKTQAELDYFDKHGYWPPTGPPSTDSTGLTPAQKKAARDKKVKEQKTHTKDIASATGKVTTQVTDVIGKWNTYRLRKVKTGKQIKDPKTGKPVDETRKAEPADVRAWLVGEKVPTTMIDIALRVRAGQKITAAQVAYLHSLDPDVRIPREWLQQERGAQGSGGTAPAQGGNRPT